MCQFGGFHFHRSLGLCSCDKNSLGSMCGIRETLYEDKAVLTACPAPARVLDAQLTGAQQLFVELTKRLGGGILASRNNSHT